MAFPLFNIRFILLISASFIAIFSSIAIYFCLPILISHMIRTQITLSPTSGSYDGWRLNSVIDRMYLYNITNLNDILTANSESAPSSNEARPSPRQLPRFQQVGPFTFRQDREKVNIKFDSTNETVIYDQKKKWTFLPELSLVKSLDEMNSMWINHISVPLAGTTLNAEYGEFIDAIVLENDLRLFVNHSVNALLFEGYYDLLMEQAKANGQVDVDRFGWMHNQNNSITKDIRVFTGSSNATLDKFGSVDQMGSKRQFYIWHNNNTEPRNFSNVSCNDFRYSSAGEFFPPPKYSLINYNNYRYYPNNNQQLQSDLYKTRKQRSKLANSTLPSTSSASFAAPASNDGDHSKPSVGSTKSTVDDNVGSSRLDKHENKIGKSISIFMPDLCRTIKLFYNGSYYYRELLVDRYIANEFTYAYPVEGGNKISDSEDHNNRLVESNKCFCIYDENTKTTSCPPNGLMDLFTCRKGSPISISFPHFLYSTKDKSLEPNLKLFSEDVEPNLEEHLFFADLETTLNVPVNVQIVLQFNVHLRNEQTMNFTKEYAYLFEDPSATTSDNNKQPLRDLYLPQMWIKSTAQIDDNNLKSLIFIQKHLNLVTPITTMIIFGFASILLMASAKLAYDLTYGPSTSRKSISCDHDSCSSLDGNHQCSYMNEKKKYFDLHLLAGEKSLAQQSNPLAHTSSVNYETEAHPSTSKKANNYVISTSSLGGDRVVDCESQPLNMVRDYQIKRTP